MASDLLFKKNLPRVAAFLSGVSRALLGDTVVLHSEEVYDNNPAWARAKAELELS